MLCCCFLVVIREVSDDGRRIVRDSASTHWSLGSPPSIKNHSLLYSSVLIELTLRPKYWHSGIQNFGWTVFKLFFLQFSPKLTPFFRLYYHIMQIRQRQDLWNWSKQSRAAKCIIALIQERKLFPLGNKEGIVLDEFSCKSSKKRKLLVPPGTF